MNDKERIKKAIKWLKSTGKITNNDSLAELLGYSKFSISRMLVDAYKPSISDKFMEKLVSRMVEACRCYAYSEKSEMTDDYCNSSGCGCKQLLNVNIAGLTNFVYRRWYKFGYFMDPNTYHVDKDVMKELIAEEAKDKYMFLCPIFSLKFIYGIVDSLPDKIDPRNGIWRVEYGSVTTERGEFRFPFTIDLPSSVDDDYTYEQTIKAGSGRMHTMSEDEINRWLDGGYWKGENDE